MRKRSGAQRRAGETSRRVWSEGDGHSVRAGAAAAAVCAFALAASCSAQDSVSVSDKAGASAQSLTQGWSSSATDPSSPPSQTLSADSTFGCWEGSAGCTGSVTTATIEAIHVSMIRGTYGTTGGLPRILAVGGSQYNCCKTWGVANTALYNIGTPGWTAITSPYGSSADAFCGGHTHDDQGRILHAGGLAGYCGSNGTGLVNSARYNPDGGSGSWTAEANLPSARYYPTLVAGTTANWAFAGYRPSLHFYKHTYGTTSWLDPGCWMDTYFTYPRVHLMYDGRFFFTSGKYNPSGGDDRRNYLFDPTCTCPNTGCWQAAGTDQVPSDAEIMYDGYDGSSVLLPLAAYQNQYASSTVLIVGGLHVYTKQPFAATPTWQDAGPRPPDNGLDQLRRHAVAATLLPTGQVFVSGGVNGTQGLDSQAVKYPEVYGIDAGTLWYNSWFTTNPATVARNYHSVALLLPDGRVWTASSNINHEGSDCAANGSTCDGDGPACPDSTNNCTSGVGDGCPERRQLAVEIFRPWYAQSGVARPVITSCPASIATNGAQYTINIGNSEGTLIDKVALMRIGSMTHAFDNDQRLVWLDIVSKTAPTVVVKAPYTTGAAPPGAYMLFVLKNNGTYGAHIPSVACWTQR